MKRPLGRCFILALILTALAPGATRAESPGDAWDLMLWLGYYEPGPEALSGDLSYGARVGYHRNRRTMISGEVEFAQFDPEPTTEGFSSKVNLFEFTYNYSFLADKRTSVVVAGGLGYASVEFAESFTVSGAVGLRANVTDSFYIRPAFRLKWFETRSGDAVDGEFLLGFGLVLF